jgi:hypothetical protein
MPDIDRKDRPFPARHVPHAEPAHTVEQEAYWIQGARAAVERDMAARVENVRIAQVFGPLESDAALLDVKTDQGKYQVVAGRDGTFTIF